MTDASAGRQDTNLRFSAFVTICWGRILNGLENECFHGCWLDSPRLFAEMNGLSVSSRWVHALNLDLSLGRIGVLFRVYFAEQRKESASAELVTSSCLCLLWQHFGEDMLCFSIRCLSDL